MTNDIYKELNIINIKTCAGSDAISIVCFKEYKFVLAIPLFQLFNLSFSLGVFLDK